MGQLRLCLCECQGVQEVSTCPSSGVPPSGTNPSTSSRPRQLTQSTAHTAVTLPHLLLLHAVYASDAAVAAVCCCRWCSLTSLHWPCGCAPRCLTAGCTCPGTPLLRACAWAGHQPGEMCLRALHWPSRCARWCVDCAVWRGCGAAIRPLMGWLWVWVCVGRRFVEPWEAVISL